MESLQSSQIHDPETVYRTRFRSETCCEDRQQLREGEGEGEGQQHRRTGGGHEKRKRRGNCREEHTTQEPVSVRLPPVAYPSLRRSPGSPPPPSLPFPSLPFPCLPASGRARARSQGKGRRRGGSAGEAREGSSHGGSDECTRRCAWTPHRSPLSSLSPSSPFPSLVASCAPRKTANDPSHTQDASQAQLDKGIIHKGNESR
jgi:hypothetical protein